MLEPTKQENPNPAVTVDPPRLARLVISWLLNRMADPKRLAKARDRAENARVKAGAPHRVDYFHQPDDPYSHLAVQKLQALADTYDIELVPHLIRATGGKEQPFPDKLATLARRDAASVAPYYALTFPGNAGMIPAPADTKLAARILAHASAKEFTARASQVSEALWSGDRATLQSLAEKFGTTSEAETDKKLDAGSRTLKEKGHYSGATFLYAGEWFWGVDRLYHLENRLRARKAVRDGTSPLIAPRPAIDPGPRRDTKEALTLEVYPSLRSPYTAVIFDTACALADKAGVHLVLKPVLPMVMRGVPATRTKGMYIFSDAAREAAALQVPYGKTYDPIGEPVRRAYSLYPWAASQGKGRELLSTFLNMAFAKGERTDNDRGMRTLVERTGLKWNEAKQYLDTEDWKEEIAQNQHDMVEGMGLWGVPSFRLRGPASEPDLMVWGQDRLWLIAKEMERRIALSQSDEPHDPPT
ncbi:MAG: DsbA family protein [Alphaproteobacteria bacterium]|mgnify:FL=1|nr:DsbA family protein [Alphaproteobacteria bacterium]MDF1626233.1 DsbA family protein [Parvibaculaceae bacterium]